MRLSALIIAISFQGTIGYRGLNQLFRLGADSQFRFFVAVLTNSFMKYPPLTGLPVFIPSGSTAP